MPLTDHLGAGPRDARRRPPPATIVHSSPSVPSLGNAARFGYGVLHSRGATLSVKRYLARSGPTVKTRDRILRMALTLFNERGETQVSLAQIADRLGISEGNLWYHFRSKGDLVAGLFVGLTARIDESLACRPEEIGPRLADFAEHARRSYRTMWDYRFLYRHRFDPREESALARRIAELIERAHRHTEAMLAELVRRRLMQATASEISELACNAWIVTRYWLDYLQERQGLAKISEQDIQAGIKQLFALYRPYLTDAARAEAAAAEHQPKRKRARG
jgi:AcrR family transcriptional regulator